MNPMKNPEEIDRDFHYKIPEKVKNNHRRTAVSVFWGLLQQWMDKEHNDDGTKYISQKAIADKMGHSRHTVQRRLEDFERVNLIETKVGYNGPKGTKIWSEWLDKAEQFKNEFYHAVGHEKERSYLKERYNRQGQEVEEDEQLCVQCCKGSGSSEQKTIQHPWHAGARTHEGQGQNEEKQKDINQTALDEGGNNTGVPDRVSENRKRWRLPQERRGHGEPIWKYLRYVRDNRWSSGDQNPIMEALAYHVDNKYHFELNLEVRRTVPTAIGKLFKDWNLKLENFEEVFDLLDELIEEVQTQVRQNVDKESAVYSAVNTFLKKNLSAFEGKDKWGPDSSDRPKTSSRGKHRNSGSNAPQKSGQNTGREGNDADNKRSGPTEEGHGQSTSGKREANEDSSKHTPKGELCGKTAGLTHPVSSAGRELVAPSSLTCRNNDTAAEVYGHKRDTSRNPTEPVNTIAGSKFIRHRLKLEKTLLGNRPSVLSNDSNCRGSPDAPTDNSSSTFGAGYPDFLFWQDVVSEKGQSKLLQSRIQFTLSPD